MSTPITPDERAEWRALADAATEGPWDVDGSEVSQHWSRPEPWLTVASNEVACMSYCYGGSARGIERDEDAAFIAAARTAVPRLLDALDTAEAEAEHYRAQRDELFLRESGAQEAAEAEVVLLRTRIRKARHQRDEARAEVARRRALWEHERATWSDALALGRRDRDEARAEVARLRGDVEWVRSGVCLLCGDGVLEETGEHIDPTRHAAEVHRLTERDSTSPAWDEDTVQAEVLGIDARHHFHGTACLCGFDSHGRARSATEHITSAVLAVVRRHLPVRPDRETIARAILNRYSSFDLFSAYGIADAVLALWPGESRAQVQATTLRDAIEHVDEASVDAYCAKGVVTWLSNRADRLTGEGGQQ